MQVMSGDLETETSSGPEALSESVTLGPLASERKLDAQETIASLQAMLAAAQNQHAAVLGRYVGLLKTRDDVIPEMVAGATLDEVDGSLAQSRAAFERLVSRLTAAGATTSSNQAASNKNSAAAGNGSGPDLQDGLAENEEPLVGDGEQPAVKSAGRSNGRNSAGKQSRLGTRVGVPVGGAMRRGRDELLADEARQLAPTAKILLGLESK